MGSSVSRQKLYDKFKSEAKIITMKSATSSKKAIKWRGKILMTGSMRNAFEEVKNQLKSEI